MNERPTSKRVDEFVRVAGPNWANAVQDRCPRKEKGDETYASRWVV